MAEEYVTEPQTKKTIQALWKLEKIILDTLDFEQVVQKIADSVLVELGYLNLGYRVIVLILHDKTSNILKRISLSQTDEAKRLLAASNIPFPNIDVPMTAAENLCVKAFLEKKEFHTNSWPEILTPPFTKEEAEYFQKLAGIKTSMVFPVIAKGQSLGVLIFSIVKEYTEVGTDEMDLIKSFTDIVGIAVQNAKIYSDLEKATKSLNDANDRLVELDKLKDEFISLASHELKTPMTGIKGSLSTVLEGFTGPISDEAKEFLVAANRENDRLLRLVNNLLNISRIQAGRLTFVIEPLSMDAVIEEVISNLRPIAEEKHLYLKYERQGDVPMVKGDADKVREVVINLIGNSLKFTKEGGIILKTELKDGMVVTSVTDTGPGISEEDQKKLFQKFSQASGDMSKKAGGTGLGLYISKEIVQGLGGEITLRSEVGKGATFEFSLPVYERG